MAEMPNDLYVQLRKKFGDESHAYLVASMNVCDEAYPIIARSVAERCAEIADEYLARGCAASIRAEFIGESK